MFNRVKSLDMHLSLIRDIIMCKEKCICRDDITDNAHFVQQLGTAESENNIRFSLLGQVFYTKSIFKKYDFVTFVLHFLSIFVNFSHPK